MRKGIIILFMLVLSSPAFSQSSIVGTWDLNWDSTKAAMNVAENEKLSAMPEATRNRVRTGFTSRTYAFQANGNIQISWESESGEKTVNGTWSLNASTLTISAEGKVNHYTVVFSGNSLSLSKQGERYLFSVLVFNKRG